MMRGLWAVAVGSGLGAVVRLSLSLLLAAHPVTSGLAASGLPASSLAASSLAANTLGAFLIGAFAGWFSLLSAADQTPPGRFFFMAGFCGGLTTFSIFSLEILLLLEAGRVGTGAAYATVSLGCWLGAVALGYRLGGAGRSADSTHV